MAKFYDKRTLNHQQALMWVGQQVFELRNAFNAQQTEAGIDGIIDLADPQTGAATGAFLGVQVKTKEHFAAETVKQFSFYADPEDLAYWNSVKIPVLLVVVRARTEEAYAVHVQDYFAALENRNSKTVSLDQGASDLPVDSVALNGDAVRMELKMVQGVYEGTLNKTGTKMTGRWQQGPNTLPLTLERSEAGDAAAKPRQAAQYQPPDYVKLALFKDKEVVVGSGEWELPGTLSLPVGKGPFPAVILVHGSGPHDRDESIGPNKPFRDLAWGLASQGVSVLRYEKRTKQYPAKVAASIQRLTVKEETVADALEAVSVARAMDGIDAKKVFVLGHSLGGMLVPRIGIGSPPIAGFIIMGGAARPLEDLILEQTLYQASLASKPSPETRKAMDEVKRQVAAVKSLSNDSPSQGMLFNAPAGYWLDLQGYNPPAAATKLKQPLLILQGERDCQVSYNIDFPAWSQALAGRKDVELKSYPGLNHLFMGVQGRSTGAEYSQPNHVAEIVVRDIAAFIKLQ
jgi:dienelactone hydrolase